nr:pectin acetylesterase 8-like [Ipomoea trifida]
MVKVGLQQWLRALVLLVVLLRTASSLVDITYVLSAVAKGADLSSISFLHLHSKEAFLIQSGFSGRRMV